ncbi:cheY-like superfamily, Signal transduction response regulator, PEP-CTERM system [Artemisia annua]|uniref:CheY-like superfamily, Signal transduction response regulator, PEP-CTERM system n=1 Tax=Artemisia annua TaxID=35608 RepID=A0A2U1QL88_ARTAN|nr:cheY-like superfamily, Signal transduction response regulator, PEP-CTERM system [Artemisia annua]
MISSSEKSPMKPLSIEDSFNPHGLKVLVVDNDPHSLLHLTEMLISCQYQVTTCSLPTEALQLIKDDNKFDMVITEVHFSPDINDIEFLEIIVRETGLPVVNDSVDTITECIMKGACTCITKPAKKKVIQLLWQHVARRVLRHQLMKPTDKLENEPSSCTSMEDKEFSGSSGSDDVQMDDDQTKKHRMVWTDELHSQFVDVVKYLGIENAVPKKVLELMNVPGLRRGNVASHLQKYRKDLQILSTNIPQGFTKQSSVSTDAYSPVSKYNDSFISTQPITEVQQEDSSIQVPGGANSQVIENKDLFTTNSPITELQPHFAVQDSSTQLVPSGAYHPVIEKDWLVGSPPITDVELQMLQKFEFDNPLSSFHDLDYCL